MPDIIRFLSFVHCSGYYPVFKFVSCFGYHPEFLLKIPSIFHLKRLNIELAINPIVATIFSYEQLDIGR